MAYLGVLLVLILTAAFLAVAAEVGLLLGRRHKADINPDARSQISMVEGALLGLLGLLLGFTFSMAVGRFDVRQELVVKEANALGTVLLRCDFLQPAVQHEARTKVREYVGHRVAIFEAGMGEEALAESLRKVGVLQSELWGLAREEARLRPSPLSAALISALNELFDLGEARLSASKNGVPVGVWVVLYLVATLTVGSLGYGSGLTGRRMILPVSLVPVLMSLILTMLVDLGHPRYGVIRISQESMIRLRDSIK